MLPTLSEILKPSILLLLTGDGFIQNNPIGRHLIEKGGGRSEPGRIKLIIIIVFPEIVLGLLFGLFKSDLIQKNLGYLPHGIALVSLPVILGFRTFNSPRILTQILLELLHLVLLLLIVVCIDLLPDQPSPLNMVRNRLQLLDTDPLLLLLLLNTVLNGIFGGLRVWDVFYEVFAPEVLVVMIVVDLLLLVILLPAPFDPLLLEGKQRLPLYPGTLPEKLLDLLLRLFAGKRERRSYSADPGQQHLHFNYQQNKSNQVVNKTPIVFLLQLQFLPSSNVSTCRHQQLAVIVPVNIAIPLIGFPLRLSLLGIVEEILGYVLRTDQPFFHRIQVQQKRQLVSFHYSTVDQLPELIRADHGPSDLRDDIIFLKG